MTQPENRDLSGSPGSLAGAPFRPHYDQSYAILVGINSYQHPDMKPLGNAENDARSMAQVLSEKNYNFKVELLLGAQATRTAVLTTLDKISNLSQPDDRIIFYFAGHGYIHKNRGYLACFDTNPRSPYDGLEYDDITKLTEFAKAKHIAFIFDACFSGKLFGLETRGLELDEDLQVYLQHRAYQALTAGAVEVVPDTRSMTTELVRVLKEGIPGEKPPLIFSHLGQYIHDTIRRQSGGKQFPACGYLVGSSKGQMILLDASPLDSLPEDLRHGLANPDPLVRRLAIDSTARYLSDPAILEYIRTVLDDMQVNDDDKKTRLRARDALRGLPPPQISQPSASAPDQQPALSAEKPGEELQETASAKTPPASSTSTQSTLPPRRAPSRRKPTSMIQVTSQTEPAIQQEAPTQPAGDPIFQVLPAPFEWCDIPAGRVSLEDNAGVFEVQPFKIARYPLTYAQFQVFIDEPGGFKAVNWWRDLEEHPLSIPEQHLKIGNHPRENVSWYAAVAFCRWLSKKAGYLVRLPTEWEWQWAAQGHAGRQYPWGSRYLKGHANLDESLSGIEGGAHLGQTSPVDRYPQGASPFGVLDMAGNVWEWCLNLYEQPAILDLSGHARRVVRGGSWSSVTAAGRCAYRSGGVPASSDHDLGFRIIQPSS